MRPGDDPTETDAAVEDTMGPPLTSSEVAPAAVGSDEVQDSAQVELSGFRGEEEFSSSSHGQQEQLPEVPTHDNQHIGTGNNFKAKYWVPN